MRIELVGEADLADLLPMMRAYCDFYEAAPEDADLERVARTLIADPQGEGLQLIARDEDREALGFATIYWYWQTLSAARAALMNDLFVVPQARGQGAGRALIEECRRRARDHGATQLVWETAPDNETAQRLYRTFDATEERWISYSLPV
jgi:GNAT superfamily N-acetyltransferase